jgi:hypothetical protein
MKIVVTLFLMLAAGCVNMSTLQTARALEPGQGRVLLGGGVAIVSVDPPVEWNGDSGSQLLLPAAFVEVDYRRGIAEGVELGLKATLPGAISIDGKIELWDEHGVALSVGLGLARDDDRRSEDESGKYLYELEWLDVFVPAYASIDLADAMALYVSPKYLVRCPTGDEGDRTERLAVVALGTRLGRDRGVFLEMTYYKNLTVEDADMLQVAGAIYF